MPELLDQYRLTDIRNVPQAAAAQVNGPMAADPAVPTFQVAYSDGSSVETTLEMAVGGWKVSSVVPVDGPADPAAPLPSPRPGTGRAGCSGACATDIPAAWRHSDRTDGAMSSPTRPLPRPAAAATPPIWAA